MTKPKAQTQIHLPYGWHPGYDNNGVTRFFIYHMEAPNKQPAFIKHRSQLLHFTNLEDAVKFCDLLNSDAISLTFSPPNTTKKKK
jgi:hypothetical protein